MPPLRFPADDSSHPGNFVEYWGWWLHLKASDGRRFGAFIQFFHFPLSPVLDGAGVGLRRTDVRLTDLSTGRVYSSSKWYAGPPDPAVSNGFALSSLGQAATGGGGNDRLHIAIGGYALDVQTDGDRPAIPIESSNGVGRADPLEMIQAYERFRMPARGSVRTATGTASVIGTAWFEHGWGNWASVAVSQWDYLELQLADGRDILAIQLRHLGGAPNFAYVGTMRSKSGAITRLHAGDFTITPTGVWRRDASCSYPSGWIVTVKGQSFVVTPTPTAQEVRSLFGNFWDGETRISGAGRGVGIAELLNYCYAPQPLEELR
jgi:predicted secreted hydrolase